MALLGGAEGVVSVAGRVVELRQHAGLGLAH
jgi:hypothetical protein